MQSATGKKKVKQLFQTKKDFIACSKLIINEFGLCLTSSNNIYFANDEQVSLAFTDVLCFTHAKQDLSKLKLYNNWSAQAVNSVLESAMWNSNQTSQMHHV